MTGRQPDQPTTDGMIHFKHMGMISVILTSSPAKETEVKDNTVIYKNKPKRRDHVKVTDTFDLLKGQTDKKFEG